MGTPYARNCNFIGNQARKGNGGALFGISASYCTFENNKVPDDEEVYDDYENRGGAIFDGNAEHCTFKNNKAYEGGAICFVNDERVDESFKAEYCTFIGNTATFTSASVNYDLYSCIFTQNKADGEGTAANGYCFNCSFYKNSIDADSGQTYYRECYDCTLVLCSIDHDPSDVLYKYTKIKTGELTVSGKSNLFIGDTYSFKLECDGTDYTSYDFNVIITPYLSEKNPLSPVYAKTGGQWVVDLPTGIYKITFDLNISTVGVVSKTLYVTSPSYIYANDISTIFGEDDYYTATLKDYLNRPICNTTLNVNLNNVTADYITDENGQINVSLKNLTPGTYAVNVNFDNQNYSKSSMRNEIFVDKIYITLSSATLITTYGSNDSFIINSQDYKSNKIKDIVLSVNLNGIEYYTTDENGQIEVSAQGLIPNNYTAEILFEGNEFYHASQTTANIIVNKDLPYLTVTSLVTVYNSDKNLMISLKDGYNNPIMDAEISVFLYELKTYSTNPDGEVEIITKDLIPDTYEVSVVFGGNDLYLKAHAVATVVVSKQVTDISMNSITAVYTGNDDLIVTLKDSQGNPMSNCSVSVNFDTLNNYTTDGNGQIIISTKGIMPDTYFVDAVFNGNEYYVPSSTSSIVIITKINTVFTVSSVLTFYNIENYLTIDLFDALGNPMGGANVSVDLNGNKVYTADVNGQIKISTKALIPGRYTANAVYNGDELYNDAKTSASVIIIKDDVSLDVNSISTTYNNNKNLVITLRDSWGNPISNCAVSVNMGSFKTYNTNSKGQVIISTKKLAPSNYLTTVSFAGDKYYKQGVAISLVVIKKATPKLTVKSKSKKLIVTLKNNKNKVMKNSKIYLKVKGKTYSAKTNSKGQAKFKISKSKSKAVVTYKGNKYFNGKTKKVKH